MWTIFVLIAEAASPVCAPYQPRFGEVKCFFASKSLILLRSGKIMQNKFIINEFKYILKLSYLYRQDIKSGLVSRPNWTFASYQSLNVCHHKHRAYQVRDSCPETKTTQVTSERNKTRNDGKVLFIPHYIFFKSNYKKTDYNLSVI